MQLDVEQTLTGAWHPGVTRLLVRCRALGRLQVPIFGASMIRGAVGHALHSLYCRCTSATRHEADCLYARLFETDAGNAFVITPPEPGWRRAGETFTLSVSLLDDTAPVQKAFIKALESGLETGLGPGHVPCELIEATPQQLQPVELGHHGVVELTTPWFTKYRNQPQQAAAFTFHSLLVAAAQRQRQLVRQGWLDAVIPENLELLRLADQLDIASKLFDVKSERRSNRQQRKHPVQGVCGIFEISHPDQNGLAPISDLLNRAQWLHGGAKVSFGLGGLNVQTRGSTPVGTHSFQIEGEG